MKLEMHRNIYVLTEILFWLFKMSLSFISVFKILVTEMLRWPIAIGSHLSLSVVQYYLSSINNWVFDYYLKTISF